LPSPPYTWYRGTFPRWDNTPRKIFGAGIYINDSPQEFRRWLEGVIAWSREQLPVDQRFIFINAWNEWAEGAFLEPDRCYGYAYLNACARALESASMEKKTLSSLHSKKIAIQIHAFHLDSFEKIINYVKRNFVLPADLLISTVGQDRLRQVEKMVADYAMGKVYIRSFPNRGRDIAPFVVGYADLIPTYDYLLHLHSKKSEYAPELGAWLDYLLNKLVGSPEKVVENLRQLEREDVGLVVPDHYPPIREKVKWGSNLALLNSLLEGTGISLNEKEQPVFPSGSMCYFKPPALKGLFSKGLRFEDFPEENGQLDGTLAHAIERSFCYFAQAAGYKTVIV